MRLNSKQSAKNDTHRISKVLVMPLLIGLVLSSFAVSCNNQAEKSAGDIQNAADTALVTQPQDSVVIDLTGEDSVSVFALLRRGHDVEYKSTAMGVFVTGIDGLTNGSGVYWVYTINDTTPQTASDKALTRSGDRVAWHYRKQK